MWGGRTRFLSPSTCRCCCTRHPRLLSPEVTSPSPALVPCSCTLPPCPHRRSPRPFPAFQLRESTCQVRGSDPAALTRRLARGGTRCCWRWRGRRRPGSPQGPGMTGRWPPCWGSCCAWRWGWRWPGTTCAASRAAATTPDPWGTGRWSCCGDNGTGCAHRRTPPWPPGTPTERWPRGTRKKS